MIFENINKMLKKINIQYSDNEMDEFDEFSSSDSEIEEECPKLLFLDIMTQKRKNSLLLNLNKIIDHMDYDPKITNMFILDSQQHIEVCICANDFESREFRKEIADLIIQIKKNDGTYDFLYRIFSSQLEKQINTDNSKIIKGIINDLFHEKTMVQKK